jgi:serine/threonine-protein kinase HipA
MELDVHVLGDRVGVLFRDADTYVFQYDRDVPPDRFVSLAMPIRPRAWAWPRDLHPFFRQNLPEGYLLSLIREEFGSLLDGTDLSLLAVVGASGIGRVTLTAAGSSPGAMPDAFDIKEVLTGDNSEARFAALVREYARSAISGAVPKFLAPSSRTTPTDLAFRGKTTIRTSRHIVKGSDASTPFLGFNEHHTMRVLERVGQFPVARTTMSEDGRALVVERFDVDEQGVPARGVEDMCGLLGRPPHEKYADSTEAVIRAAEPYLPHASLHEQRRRLGWLILSTYVVRNADCHTKNIALCYSGTDDVEFAPVYDMVTTQAYPRYADNAPALSIGGRKTWVPGKVLEKLFATRLAIHPSELGRMIEALCDAVAEVGREVIEAARQDRRWHDVAKGMVHAWNEGTEKIRSAKPNPPHRALQPAIDEARLSDPEPPPARERVGRSELLPRKGRAF